MEKIELYKTRTFSEKLNDTLGYLRENWRPLLKFFIYLMLPCSIVLAFFMNHFWGGYMKLVMGLEDMGGGLMDNSELLSFGFSTAFTVIVYLAAYILLVAFFYAMFRLYQTRQNRLEGLTGDELKPELMSCLRRATVLMLVSIPIAVGVVAVVGALMVGAFMLSPVFGVLSMFFLYAALLAAVVPFTLVTPIYMLENDITVIGAFQKAFHLGFATWGGIVAVSFIVGLLASVIQTVTMGPWYVLFIIKMVFTVSSDLDGSFVNSIVYTLVEYITCVLQCLGMLLSAVITLVGLTIQYGHAADKIDGVGVVKKIEQFDAFDNF